MSYEQYLENHYKSIKFEPNSNWVLGEFDADSYIKNIIEAKSIKSCEDHRYTLLATFLEEIWIGESNVKGINTIEVIEVLLDDETKLQKHLEQKVGSTAFHLTKKLINLKQVVKELFYADNIIENETIMDINTVKELHRIIGRDIISSCGEFRTIDVKPANSVFRYCIFRNIERHLNILINFTNKQLQLLEKESDIFIKTKKALLLGSLFFSEFLFIHPFSNGNGRLARILLNIILKSITIIPFSLYFKDRNAYMDAIESRNDRFVKPPNILSTYILLCASL